MYLLNHLIPSSEPKQWDKLMAHNVVQVSYAVQNYFVCYPYEPNVPFESPYSFLRAKTVHTVSFSFKFSGLKKLVKLNRYEIANFASKAVENL